MTTENAHPLDAAPSQSNPQLELAAEIVNHTGTSLFLTGKAGTGKTTFLKNLRQNSSKRMVVVAPTGVAAINAGGVTMHSFFQLSFAPFIPGADMSKEFFRFNREKINIIRTLDLLVIDEISMVRADLLDAVDFVLRHFRRNEKPFGGAQLLMIGDLQQLAPVVKDDEWGLLKKHYASPFFFNSRALEKSDYTCVELKTVYRQADEAFIHLLNKVRENKMDDALLEELNARHIPNFVPEDKDEYITLSTHNSSAARINQSKLEKLNSPLFTYNAVITGTFPEYSHPTDAALALKKGAQVMFVKNDPSQEKRYYNGKIGVVVRIGADFVEVRAKDEAEPINVEKVRWSNVKYKLDSTSGELKEEEEGAFEQYPLKVAWAITIHKSQGLTFERAVIDARESFAHGQVYVALSRCKTLQGMVLSTPIGKQSVVRDEGVNAFIREAGGREPDAGALSAMKKTFLEDALFEQFSFLETSSRLRTITWLLKENFARRHPELLNAWRGAEERFRVEVLEVAGKFKVQLERLLAANATSPEINDATIQERTGKGSVYFLEKLAAIFTRDILDAPVETESLELRKRWTRAMQSLKESLRVKQSTLEYCREQGRWTAEGFIYARAKALANDPEGASQKKKSREKSGGADIQKTDTRQVSYALYKSGKSIEEIARERSLVVGTIEGHMIPYVATGEIPLSAFVPAEKVEKIRQAFAATPGVSMTEIKNTLGESFSYSDLRFVQAASHRV
jgi:hypothetical protein